jgi:tetratricopeptide (TPR) repeat protein
MPHISTKDAANSIQRLLEINRFEQALVIVERMAQNVRKVQHWEELRSLIEKQFASEQYIHHQTLAPLYARSLLGSYELEHLKAFLDQALPIHQDLALAKLRVEQSMLDYVELRHQQAVDALEQALPYLQGIDRGIGLARLGMNRFKLGLNWQEPFLEMRQFLTGRALGIQLTNESGCYKQAGDLEKSITIIYEALPHLKQDNFIFANTQTALGLTLLRICRPEAIEHFEIAERITRGRLYKKLHAHIKKCMAAYYRTFGQWRKASELYKQCIQIAANPSSLDLAAKDEATLNLGRTLRLQGKPLAALKYLQEALPYYPLGASGVLIERAAAYLQLEMRENARECLQAATAPQAEDVHLKQILEAELHRQAGNPTATLEALLGVPTNQKMAREEASIWTDLWQFAAAHGMVIPEPIAAAQNHHIHLMNLGTPQVFFDSREVQQPPRALELLAYLSWHGGSSGIEDCIEALYPDSVGVVADYINRFERILETLRKAIALPEFIQRKNSAISLSQNLDWTDDAMRFVKGEDIAWRGIYLTGIRREWIDEVATHLEGLRLRRFPELELTEKDELRILQAAKQLQKNQ